MLGSLSGHLSLSTYVSYARLNVRVQNGDMRMYISIYVTRMLPEQMSEYMSHQSGNMSR